MSEHLQNLGVLSKSVKAEIEYVHDSSEVIHFDCEKVACIKQNVLNEALQSKKLLLLQKTIQYLEGRIHDQEIIIKLLETYSNKKTDNESHSTPPCSSNTNLISHQLSIAKATNAQSKTVHAKFLFLFINQIK